MHLTLGGAVRTDLKSITSRFTDGGDGDEISELIQAARKQVFVVAYVIVHAHRLIVKDKNEPESD